MSNDIIQRFNNAKLQLAQARDEHDAAASLKDSFISDALQRHLRTPSTVTGYHEHTSPVSNLHINYRDGIAKGWTLKDIRTPSQFAVVLIWQTEELTDKAIKQRCKQLAELDWQRHIEPIETRLAYAEHELEQVSAEVRQLQQLFTQVQE